MRRRWLNCWVGGNQTRGNIGWSRGRKYEYEQERKGKGKGRTKMEILRAGIPGCGFYVRMWNVKVGWVGLFTGECMEGFGIRYIERGG